jgi:carboxyl-terminal processing protease
VDGKNASEVAEKVRGEEGTSVKLTMKRSGETKEYTIIRQKVNDASVRSEVRDGVGIMTISRFDNDTGSLARKAAEDFTTKNVKAVVLDLRDNGGGYVDAAQDVASLWLKDKVVVVEKTGDTVQDTVRTRGTAPLEGIKTIVLVNGASASASEIVAGALQDYEAATLYGEKTFGKGTVQQVISLSDGRRLKVTVARWYTPHGVNISKNGIKPNKEVTLSADDVNNSRDPQMNAALEVLR